MQAILTTPDTLFEERRAGTLTPARYAELERQGLAEIDQVMGTLPAADAWMRAELEAEITRYRPNG